jgi:hypothetical protein
MIRVALAFLVLAVVGAAEAAPATVSIGDLILDYDDAEWRVSRWPNGIVLRAADCAGFRCEEGTGITISVAPVDSAPPTDVSQPEMGFVEPLWELMDDAPPWPGEGAIREINGFAIFATDRWSGCRAMSPSELTAILDHAGRRYTFASGIAAACGGVWGVSREAFVEILSGLRPRT